MFRRLIPAFAAPVLAALTLAFLSAQPSTAAERKELVIGITQYPSTFHPNIDAMLAKSYVLGMTRRPITVTDADWKLVCLLCTILPTLENGLAIPEKTPDGKDGIAVTYTLLAEAVWGDGTPISTEDVKFTWEVGRHPKSGVSAQEFYRSAYKLDIKDGKTFTFHYDKRTFDYNDITGFDLVPAHVDRKNFDDPAQYKTRTAFDTETANPGLYMGPYRIADAVTGSHVVLVRNSKWWGKAPAFDKITVRVIENTAALEANLLSGGVDMIAGELGLSLDQALAFEPRHGAKYDVIYKSGLIYEHIDLNLDNPILQDRRVRQALLYSLDRKSISERLFGGKQPVADTNVNPLDRVYAADVPKYPYDPKKADALFKEAGWSKLVKGVRVNAKGESLRFEFMTTAGNRSRELVQQVLQSQWKAAGVDVRIRNEPARVFFGQTVTQRKFTAMAMFAWISAPESVPRSTLHSKHIPNADNNWGGQNYTGYKNPEMDTLLESIETELDRDKRMALWKAFQNVYATDLPVLPLYFRANPSVLPKWLKGLRPTGHQFPSSLWVEDWRVE